MYGRVNSCLYIILILKSVVCAVWNHAPLEETSVCLSHRWGKVPWLRRAFLWSLDLVMNGLAGLVQVSRSRLGLLSQVGPSWWGQVGPPLLSLWIFGPPG